MIYQIEKIKAHSRKNQYLKFPSTVIILSRQKKDFNVLVAV